MFIIANSKYLDFLSKLGVGGAHPGGINLTRELFKAENVSETSHILDVGCGTGQTAAFLATTYKANVTGIDINPIMITKAKSRMKNERLAVKIMQGSIEDVLLPDEQFDVVLSESVLSFVNKPKAFREIFRLLKDNGRFIAIEFTVNQRIEKKAKREIQQFYGFDSFPTKKDWVSLLEQAGFTNIRIHKNNSFTSEPEFHYSEHIEPELHEIMDKHYDMHIKYAGILDYRIYSCTK